MADFFKQFRSINEMVSYLDNAEVTPNFKYHQESNSSDSWFHGYKDYAEAREMILKGDKDLQKKLRGTEKLDINIPATGTKKKMCTGVAGFMPHVPNFLAGVPNNMIFVREQKVAQPVITVVYNIGCLGSSSFDTVLQVSARVMSAIMSAERKGYRINLYVASAQNKGSQNCGMVVKIKDSDQHIDTLKMALPMISPAMNRRFGFRFRETMQGLSSGWVRSYGSSMSTSETQNFLNRQNFKYDVCLAFESIKYIKSVEELEKIFVESTKTIKNNH